MHTHIKICCIASLAEAQLAIGTGADAVGFVAARPVSARTIDDVTIAAITPLVSRTVVTFLLTSERTAADVARHVLETGVSTVQILAPLSIGESEQLAK